MKIVTYKSAREQHVIRSIALRCNVRFAIQKVSVDRDSNLGQVFTNIVFDNFHFRIRVHDNEIESMRLTISSCRHGLFCGRYWDGLC